jgi:hypothetical protein
MRLATMPYALGAALIALSLGAWRSADSGPQAQRQAPSARAAASGAARVPLILAAGEGERRIRRVMAVRWPSSRLTAEMAALRI